MNWDLEYMYADVSLLLLSLFIRNHSAWRRAPSRRNKTSSLAFLSGTSLGNLRRCCTLETLAVLLEDFRLDLCFLKALRCQLDKTRLFVFMDPTEANSTSQTGLK